MQHLWYVQTSEGREIASWKGDVKLTDVSAVRVGDKVNIEFAGKVVASGPASDDMTDLLRVPADDKLSEPVAQKVKVAE